MGVRNIDRIRQLSLEELDPLLVYEVKEFPKTEAGVRTALITRDYKWVADYIRKVNPVGVMINS